MKIQKSDLITLLSDFNQYDWRGLRKFIESPYYNTRRDVKELFFFLKNALFISKDPKMLSSKIILSKLSQVNNEKSLRYAMSFLFQLANKFLIIGQKKKDTLENTTLYISALRQRNKFGLIKKSLAKIDRNAYKGKKYTSKDIHQSYLLNLERHALRQSSNRNDTSFLVKASQDLDLFFTIEKLRLHAHFLVHQSMTQIEYNDPFINSILLKVESDKKQPLLVLMFGQACLALTHFEKESYYHDFKAALLQNGHRLNVTEEQECFIIAVNYCIRKLNNGLRNYVGEVFELYQAGLERKAFEENGYLSRFTYKNIATAALGMGKTQWAEDFLYAHKEALDPRYREDAFRYNLAILQYKKKDYQETLKLLRDVEFEDLFFNLNARTMILKIFFEEESWSSLDSHLDSFKAFLYRHDELGYQKNHYLHLVRYTRRLLRSYNYGQNKKESLRQRILSEPELAEKTWLLEKLV